MASGAVDAGIDEFEVLDLIGDEPAEDFVVGLARELEGAAEGSEGVVCTQDEMNASLGFQITVEGDEGVALAVVDGHAEFAVERRLVVEAGGQAEGPSGMFVRHEADACAGAEEKLAVVVGI